MLCIVILSPFFFVTVIFSGKKYVAIEGISDCKDMGRADSLAELIRQDKFEEIKHGDLKILTRYGKEESIVKLMERYKASPCLDMFEIALACKKSSLALLFLGHIKDVLREKGKIGTILHMASFYDDQEVAEQALLLGIGINIVNQYKDTPLHLAVARGHTGMVDFLCSRGANPFIVNERNHGRRFNAMDIAYRHMEKMINPAKELPEDVAARKQRYYHILHILDSYAPLYGGQVTTCYTVE